MSNLKLAPDEPTPLERLLLDASRSEQPSDEHKARLRAALGIGVPLSGPLASPPQVADPAGNAASTGAATGLGKSAGLAKLALGVGALGVAGALWFTQRSEVSPPLAVRPSPVVQAAPATVPAEPSAVEVAPEVSPLPPVVRSASAPRARVAPSAASTDDLGEQIRLIEAARAGVAARDSRAALAALGDYSTKFPRGSFGQEASVLRIRAIDQAGDSARATAMAKAFIARFPTSPHVARLKPIAERGASR
jgi:hypothetical protein